MEPITEIAGPPVPSNTPRRPTVLAWIALAVIAVVMLGGLIQQQSVEWSVNEQYGYGWAVPLLCGFLFWRRWQSRSMVPAPNHASGTLVSYPVPVLAVLVLLFFVFTRWIGEANPDWRLVSWALALEVIAGSMVFLYVIGGVSWVKHFAFPILFFLIAVPWPTLVEQPVIQLLTRGIVAATVELLNAFGMAALPRGNIIETAGGLVDVDEACSGVRSLQAALMLSLFFGELHRFTLSKRVALCGISFALACLFNLARTAVLSLIAAQQGSAAVQRWHDIAGTSILVGCFAGVWGAAMWLGRNNKAVEQEPSGAPGQGGALQIQGFRRLSAFQPWLVVFAIALVTGEGAVQLWYGTGKPGSSIHWNPQFPRTNPTFQIIELSPAIRNTLRFNEGESAAWRNNDKTAWQMIYLRWKPGRVAAHLARNHTPEVCLPATGKNLREISEMQPIHVENLALPFRCYITEQNGRPLFVFYSLWEEGASEQRVTTEFLTARTRWEAVMQRRRNPGQRVLQIVISGPGNFAEAEASLRQELPRLVHIQPR